MPKVRRWLVTSLALLVPIAPLISIAVAQRSGIETYAITNARIVTVSGPVIERGTVILRDGLITAVGANVAVPADARVIDGVGLTVYPGLIDSNTSLGLPPTAPVPAATATPGAPVVVLGQLRPQTFLSALNSPQPPGLQPEVMVEDFLKPGGEEIESARNAGITTALTAPRAGIWMGHSALINLTGETTQQMIIRSPVAMHVGFTPLRGSTYPGSLMGVFAVLRQMLLDAQRYREMQQAYERAPRGMRRPEQDRSLAALLPVLDGAVPVVMYADREREISRALDLAQEFKLKAIIAGGLESASLRNRLRENNVPVLLSLNYPRRTTANLPEADPEPLRVLRERVAAPKTAAQLAGAKVRFAFQTSGLTNMSDFSGNLVRSIENGLSREDALRALTIWPAEIFGVSDRLGSIEPGKIANLTVTRGDLFDRNRQIAHVFIDGRPIDLRAPTVGSTTAGMATGAWTLNVNVGTGSQTFTVTMQQEGERLRGSFQGQLGSGEISNASVAANGDIKFTASLTLEGLTREATFEGKITGNQMQGRVLMVDRAPGEFTGTREGAPATPSPFPAAAPSPSPTPPGALSYRLRQNSL